MFLAVRVTLLGVFLTLFATFPALPAQGLSEPDLQAARTALAAAQSGDWPRAYASAAAIGDPLPVAWTARAVVRANIEAVIAWLEVGDPALDEHFLERAGEVAQAFLSRHEVEA